MNTAVIVTFTALTILLPLSSTEEYDLQLVNIIFRHGSRTPERTEVYPNDPLTKQDFHPFGYGRLTNKGKRDAYQLGKKLHDRYGKFVDENRTRDIVWAQSTDFERTRTTTLLVSAGLFPPTETDKWNDELNWNPIPCNYEKLDKDHLLWKPTKICPAFARELNRLIESDEHKKICADNSEIFEFITSRTGMRVDIVHQAFKIHQALDAEHTLNLTLPKWTESVFPGKLRYLAAQKLILENRTPLLTRLFSGRLMKTILEDMKKKSLDTLTPEGRKVFLYGGHDMNIAGMLILMRIYDNVFPDYASAVLLELYKAKSTDEYGVKVSYLKNPYSEIEEKIIPGCELICPLSRFEEIVQPFIPGNISQECV